MARIAAAVFPGPPMGNKLSQRLWNGAGGGYDAFLIDVHLKKREERFDSIMRCCLAAQRAVASRQLAVGCCRLQLRLQLCTSLIV